MSPVFRLFLAFGIVAQGVAKLPSAPSLPLPETK
jgi:hypothetical protein